MWNTPAGERVLAGRERSLFIQAAASLAEHILADQDEDPVASVIAQTDVGPFHRLEPAVRVVLLAEVVRALVDPAVAAPDLTAVNEAAVYAVFRSVSICIDLQIDGIPLSTGPEADPLYWRRLVLAALLEATEREVASLECSAQEQASVAGPKDEERTLALDSTDPEDWHSALEILADSILWDRDFLIDASAAALEQARAYLRQLADEDRASSAGQELPAEQGPQVTPTKRSKVPEVEQLQCLRINRPAWFANPAFQHWLERCPRLATWHIRGTAVGQLSDVFLVYSDGECAEVYLDQPPEDVPDFPLFPRQVWNELQAICQREGFTSGVLWLSNSSAAEEEAVRSDAGAQSSPPS
jgi:hypothetical protein